METALYLNDSYLKEFAAEVLSEKDSKFIVLDKTAFYPNSGGQPFDTGKLVRESDGKEFSVVFVGKFSGQISHEVKSSDEGSCLKAGDKVKGIIDWDRRYRLMRSHTAAHIVSGMFSTKLGAKITGNQIEMDKVRIDFDLENFNRELIEKEMQESNELIKKDLKIKVYEMRKEEVEKNPEMVKLAAGLPPEIEVLRIVEIEGFDRQPDGGTHVKSLKEVGLLEIIKLENKGKTNRRVYFKLAD